VSEDASSELAARALRAHVNYFRAFTARGGGAVVELDGVVSWRSVHSIPFLVNTLVRLDPSVDAQSVLAAGNARFRGGFETLGLVGADDDLLEEAARQHYEVGDADPLQVLTDPARLGDPVVPPAIEVRDVVDALGVADIAAVNRDATAGLGFPDDVFTRIFAEPASVLADDIDAVVAYHDGRAVATAQVFVDGETAYVGWVATRPSAMRAGLGTLVTHAVIARARRRGAELVTLMASPMGAPVYRRMGFVDVGHVRGAICRRPD
jgi:GNAT superfamily N-acetyltransferase